MIIDTVVKTKWVNATKKHYEDLGYIYEGNNCELIVPVEDLPSSSGVKIRVKCDECGIIKSVKYSNYVRSIRSRGNYYCKICNSKIMRANKLSESISNGNLFSFKDWCINNNKNNILESWDYKLNDTIPENIPYGTHQKYYFKCPNGIHDSEQKSIISILGYNGSSTYCSSCNSFAQYLLDEFGENGIEQYWGEQNEISPWSISAGTDTKYVFIKCQEREYHGEYKILPMSFKSGVRCSYCNGNSVHLYDSLGYKFADFIVYWSDKNNKSPFDYKPFSNKKVWWKCKDNKHDDYFRTLSGSIAFEFRCPKCSYERKISILQEKVDKYISNDLGYEVKHERECSLIPINSQTKCAMPFDNEIVDLKLIIEVHGQHHYITQGYNQQVSKRDGISPEDVLNRRQKYDKYKKDYALSLGYHYLEIPFWTSENDLYKSLIDEKISEIISLFVQSGEVV